MCLNNFILGKEELQLMKNTKKVKEPVLTAEEKASISNKADIKFTGKILYENFP